MQKLHWLILCVLAFPSVSCAGGSLVIKHRTACQVAGSLDAGAICASSRGAQTELSLEQTISFLEPTQDKAAAIMISFEEFSRMKFEIDYLCRLAGSRCQIEK